MPAPDDLRGDIRRAIEEVESATRRAEPLVTPERTGPVEIPAHAPPRVRAFITKAAVWCWLLYILIVGVAIIGLDGWLTDTRANLLIEILKIGVLPILTLAIGHYFGSKGD